jgi:uncharacterized protein YjiS (DUF1127 family)
VFNPQNIAFFVVFGPIFALVVVLNDDIGITRADILVFLGVNEAKIGERPGVRAIFAFPTDISGTLPRQRQRKRRTRRCA